MRTFKDLFVFLAILPVSVCGAQTLPATTTATATVPSFTESEEKVDLTTTSLVTVHLKAATPDVAASAIAAQAAVPTRLTLLRLPKARSPIPYQAHDFDVEKQPYLQALMHLCSVYDLNENSAFTDQRTLARRGTWESISRPARLVAPEWARSPSCISGPFAVFAKEIERNRVFDPVDPANGSAGGQNGGPPLMMNLLQMFIVVAAEPGIAVLQRPFYPVVETMVDDQNTSLWATPGPDGVVPRIRAPQNAPWELLLALQSPGAQAKVISKFSGSVRLQVVTRVDRVELKNLDDGLPRDFDVNDVRATLSPIKGGSGDQTATITLYRDQMDPQQWSGFSSLVEEGSQFQVFDQAGVVLRQFQRWSIQSTSDHLAMGLRFGRNLGDGSKLAAGKPSRLLWDAPLEAGEVAVPFSFTNLPLPPP